MRSGYLSSLLMFFSLADLISEQALPSWSPHEREKLEKGEQIPGAEFLVNDPDDSPLPRAAPEPEVSSIKPVVSEPEYDPKTIPWEYLRDYFASSSGHYLVDPEKLLSRQEFLDREVFLEDHADDSQVDTRMYLFDARQEIPVSHTLQKPVNDRYVGDDLTSVVFCFLGDPSRNLLAFGGKGASGIQSRAVGKILQSTQMKAMEKSDPGTQVESFIVQLFIRLYWLGKSLGNATVMTASSDMPETASPASKPPTSLDVMTKGKPHFLFTPVGFSGLLLSFLGMGIAWILWARGRAYHFPVLEIPRRLGADSAAGVGAMIAFHDEHGSPSSQRNQVPDHLTRA